MNKSIITYCIVSLLFSIVVLLIIYIRYKRALKAYLNSEESKGINGSDLLKELFELSDEESKKQITNMLSSNIDTISEGNTIPSNVHFLGRSSKYTNSLTILEAIKVFNFKLGQDFESISPCKDKIYVAELTKNKGYKVTWSEDKADFYELNNVVTYISNGIWVVEGEDSYGEEKNK